jgi:signal-transduction protein with cAMP-binding, CBS, and nucleotidyltransferase domain
LQNLPGNIIDKHAGQFVAKMYTTGDIILRENTNDNGFFIISRGTAKIEVASDVVDIIGQGSFFGEMSLLTGNQRTATVKAESPLSVLWISLSGMKDLVKEAPAVENTLWSVAGQRYAELALRKTEPYCVMRQKDFHKWLKAGQVILADNSSIKQYAGCVIVLVKGEVNSGGTHIKAPAVINPETVTINEKVRIFVGDKV